MADDRSASKRCPACRGVDRDKGGVIELHPLAALAEALRCSEKTARRRLDDAMARDPGLRVVRRGRTILMTPDQIQRTIKALEWRSTSASAATSTTRAAPYASGRRSSPSASSAQERALEQLRKHMRPTKRPASAMSTTKATPGRKCR